MSARSKQLHPARLSSGVFSGVGPFVQLGGTNFLFFLESSFPMRRIASRCGASREDSGTRNGSVRILCAQSISSDGALMPWTMVYLMPRCSIA